MAQSTEQNSNRNGLILGKFMPLTTGHCYLIDTSLTHVEKLTILVCSLRDDPIEGHLRYGWVRETYPQCNVIHVTDELPSYPHEHPNFWDLWKEVIHHHEPNLDVVFTSEEYGEPLAAVLGCKHICVDLPRSKVPISATAVRANPLGNWEFLPPAVRPYYVKRVLLYGAESTGKSIMARQLAEHFQTSYVPEFARGYLEAKGDYGSLTYEDISAIAIGQLESEEEAVRQSNKMLFCDSDLITTSIYSHFYFGKCPHFIQRIADERRYDLYLLTDIDVPWEADGWRELGHRREEYHDIFRAELDSRRIEYVLIRGLGEERLQAAIAAVVRFLEAQEPG